MTLFVASSAFAADLNVWIGLTGIQTSGNTRYVNSMIGSNEDLNSAVARMIFTTLTVKAADGTSVCNVSVEKNMVVRPAITPLQFRVTYPIMKVKIPLGTRKYTLYGTFKIEGNPAHTGNDTIEYTLEFPGGGTPSCVNLLN